MSYKTSRFEELQLKKEAHKTALFADAEKVGSDARKIGTGVILASTVISSLALILYKKKRVKKGKLQPEKELKSTAGVIGSAIGKKLAKKFGEKMVQIILESIISSNLKQGNQEPQ